MHVYISPILYGLVPLLLWCYVVWKGAETLGLVSGDARKWQTAVTILALTFATVSTGLSAFLLVHAAFTGGYPFYHPVELFCIRVGFLTALVGLVAGPIGRRKLRVPVAVLSAVNLLLWLADAMWQ